MSGTFLKVPDTFQSPNFMSSFKKTILICASAAVLIIAGIYFARSFSTPKIGDDLKLKAPKDKILSVQEIDDVRCDSDGANCVNMGKIEKYQYVSDVEVPPTTYQGLQEDITQRTSNAQFFKQGEDEDQEQWVARFYPQQPFYKDENQNKWFQTETATTSIVAFASQTKLSFWEKLLGKRALADTFYAGAGDGNCFYSVDPATWAVAHASSTCSTVNYTGAAFNIEAGGRLIGATGFRIYRGFIPFNTSAIPSNAIISSSTFYLYVDGVADNDNDGDDWVAVVQTSQADSASLVIEDFDQCGAVTNPTEGSNRVDITNITASKYQSWTLNSTGRGWIKRRGEISNCGTTAGVTCLGIREGHDAIDSAYAVALYTNITAIASEQAGTVNDPYLTVSYSYYHRTIINRPQTNYLTGGLVGNWTFNGPDMNFYSNSAYDRSGSYATGTMINMSTTTSPIGGISGQALSFDGVDDWVSMGDPANGSLDFGADVQFTLSFWMKSPSHSYGSGEMIMVKRGTAGYQFWGKTTCPYYCSSFVIDEGANNVVTMVSNNLYDNRWHHVVAGRSAAEHFVYVDGQYATSTSDNTLADLSTTANFEIGSEAGTWTFYNGLLDEFRVYNRALSASEVQQLYQYGAARMKVNTPETKKGAQGGLVGNWSFNGPDMNWQTNSAYDRSGSYATGTMIDMSTTTSPTDGISGQALSFDGVDDYVNLGNPASLDITSNAVTISAWIKPDTFVSGGSGVISKGELGGPTWAGQYSLTFPGASDILRFTVCTASCVYFNLAAGTSGITVGTWSHIVGVYDGAQGFMYIYVNGVSKGTPSAQTGNIVTNGMNLSLGIHAVNGGTPSMFFDGLIDEARIYNRALSASEVQQLYQIGAARVKIKQ